MTQMAVLLHGTFVDEFLIEIVLPLSIFGGLYWWSSRKEKKKRGVKTKDDRRTHQGEKLFLRHGQVEIDEYRDAE